jgi:hypothetical protein
VLVEEESVMNQTGRALRDVLALLAVILGQAVVFAAPDDQEPPPAAAVANEGFFMAEENFDQWIFQGVGNANAGRERIKSRLKLQLDELDRVCGLTETQKQKLTLAAHGDTKRFFDQVEEVRKRFQAVKNDQNAFNQIWQEIQPLQQKQMTGLFGETSFFAKTLRKTLSTEQAAKYKVVVDDRRRFRYRASIEVALMTLENSVALRHEQHAALSKLLIEETQPPHVFGQYDYYLVMHQLSKLSEQKVKPLLDERQWKLLQQQFVQFRGMEAFLVQNGMIAKDDKDQVVQNTDDAPADATKPEQSKKGE